jgi:fatty acid desaturase
MDAVFSRRKLIEPKALRGLMQRSDLRGTVQAGSHFGAIFLTGALLAAVWGSWWAVPVFVVHGTLLNFLYAGQHELSHNTPFKTKALNEWVGRVIGFLMLYPRDFDQIQHHAHHQFTQNWEKDGELVRQPYTLTSYLLWFFGPTYWYSRVARIVRLARGIVVEPYIRPDQEPLVVREARVHAALYGLIAVVSVAAGSWVVVMFWLAPMVLMKPIHQLQNTIEHLGLSHEDDILKNTRSTDTNAVLRWMCWNMQYHTAHHSFPSVPFWKLRMLNDTIETRIGHEVHRMGYIEFQIEVIRKLMGGKTEADYPHDEVWIARGPKGVGQMVVD